MHARDLSVTGTSVEGDQSPLPGEIKQLKELLKAQCSVLTWLEGTDQQRTLLKKMGFTPPPGDIRRVQDSDGKLRWWNIEDEADKLLLEGIEERGSISVYLLSEDDKVTEKFHTAGFKLSFAEQVLENAKLLEAGDIPENVVGTFLSRMKDAVVVGSTSEEYDDHRCFRRFNFKRRHSSYEYERWIGSMFDLLNDKEANCFLVATHSYGDEFKKDVKELFSELHIIYRRGSITIPLFELKKLIVD